MSPGDVIRVRDWPGTSCRRRYLVTAIGKDGVVYALELRSGETPWKERAFPIAFCTVDPTATAKRRRATAGKEA